MPLSSSLTQVIAQLRTGQLTALELCHAALKRVELLSELNAVVTPTPQRAHLAAYNTDIRFAEGGFLSPLDGIPFAAKDNFCTVGVRTSCASQMLKPFKPPYNATVVEKMLNQGALLIGKTNMDEFAMGCGSVDSIYGPVRNPWKYKVRKKRGRHQHKTPGSVPEDAKDWHIVGGSSGGSAVAVATGMALAALGSDTGGSTRNPASYCGVVGLKPTYGRLSRHGLIPLVNSLDVPGILTKTVDDAALIFNALAGHDVKDSTTVADPLPKLGFLHHPDVEGLKVGIPKEYHAPGTSPDVVRLWRQVADKFASAGSKVSQVSLPNTQYSIVCYAVLCACEVASNMARYDGIEYGHRADADQSTEELYAATRRYGFNDVVRGRILAGNFFLLRANYEKFFMQAQRVRRLITEDFRKVFESVDILLTPTVLSDAPLYSDFSQRDSRAQTQEQDVFTQPINLAGIPAITIPVGMSSNGLPIGLQLIAPNFQEQRLLNTAKWLEQEMNFKHLDVDLMLES